MIMIFKGFQKKWLLISDKQEEQIENNMVQ